MNGHVFIIVRTCYFELPCMTSISSILTNTATATLDSAFVMSGIYYCSSLLFGSIHDVTSCLQRMPNYAAQVLLPIQNHLR